MTIRGYANVRIALVCDYPLDDPGGAQSVLLDEAALFRSAGEDVTVIAATPTLSSDRPTTPGAVLVRGMGRVPGAGVSAIRNSRALRRRLRRIFVERSIEVVHLHSEFGLTAAATAVAQELGIPVVQTVHSFFWQGPDLRGLDRAAGAAVRGLARLLRGRGPRARAVAPRALASALRSVTLTAAMEADAVISPSAHQAAALRDAGLAAVDVVPNPMRSTTAPGAPLDRIDGPLRIVWIGRLAREKRLLEFLHAVVLAIEELGPGALDVTIVGEGPLYPEAQEVARAASHRGGCSIRFTGRVERDEVERLIARSHLVAHTSLGFDTQPVVVVEAFQAARSVLYVDPRLREGLAEAGILCGSPHVGGMTAMLVELARHPAIVVERSARTVAASQRFRPESHARAVRDAWAAARRRMRAAGAGSS